MVATNLIKLAVVTITAFFAILSVTSSNNARYIIFDIPYNTEVILFCFIAILALSAIPSILQKGQISILMVLSLLISMILLAYSHLISAVLNRSDVQFDYFLIATLAGFWSSLGAYREAVRDAISFSILIISFSVLVLAILPKYLGLLVIYSAQTIDEIGFGSGLFHKNSGILLNNNTFGAMISISYAFLMYHLKSNVSSIQKYLPITILYFAILLSGNATSFVFTTVLNFILLYSSIKSRSNMYLVTIINVCMACAVLVYLYEILKTSYVSYKLKSGAAKIEIFSVNLNDFFASMVDMIFGHKSEALLSESTLIDLLYYFGFPILILLLGSLLYLALLQWIMPFRRGEKVLKSSYLIVITFLLLAQNSVLMIGPSFILGYLSGSTVLSWRSYKVSKNG